MGVLKTITDEYFGDSIRKEDEIDISGLDVEIVSFTDKNGRRHSHGYRVKNGHVADMAATLTELINRIIEKRGNECSLNDIDVSNITQMRCASVGVFEYSIFNGDISGWNVSNLIDMGGMFSNSYFTGKKGIFKLEKGNKVENIEFIFRGSDFDGNLSDWDVSNIKNMRAVFSYSKFTGKNGIFKLEKGNKVENMVAMFKCCNFNEDISSWDISNVKDMRIMFKQSRFTGKNGIFKLEKGNKVEDMTYMFEESSFEGDINDWVVNDNCDIRHMLEKTPLETNGKLPKWYPKWYKIDNSHK